MNAIEFNKKASFDEPAKCQHGKDAIRCFLCGGPVNIEFNVAESFDDYPDTCQRCGMDLVDRPTERDHTDTRHCHNCAGEAYEARRDDRHPL